MSDPVIELYFDYASPFSYVADVRLEPELAGLPVRVRRIPVYLRGFEAFESSNPASSAKTVYLARDLSRCARHYEVPIGAQAVVPVDGLYLLRGYLMLEGRPEQVAYHHAALRATWVDGANVSDADVVADIAESVGIGRDEFTTGSSAQAVKHQLRANTELAIERGAFGVPTFFVGDEMFWGQDRLEYVRRHVEDLASAVGELSDPDDDP